MPEAHRGISAIERLEHSDENDAKKVNSYVWDGSAWVRSSTSTPLDLNLDDTTTANVTYVGEAALGSADSAAAWQIQKIDETTGLTVSWGGTGAFDQVWNNRATTVVYT